MNKYFKLGIIIYLALFILLNIRIFNVRDISNMDWPLMLAHALPNFIALTLTLSLMVFLLIGNRFIMAVVIPLMLEVGIAFLFGVLIQEFIYSRALQDLQGLGYFVYLLFAIISLLIASITGAIKGKKETTISPKG